MPRVGRLEAGRVGVGAHEPQRRVAAGPAPGARSCRASAIRRPRSLRISVGRTGAQRARELRARSQRLGISGSRPQPGGRDRRHRARAAGERQLQRDPAAERVAGDVRTVEAERSVRAIAAARSAA